MYYNLTLFGDNFRNIRKKLGFTRKSLSDVSGVHSETLRRIESGNIMPKVETLEILSFYLKEDLNLLLIKYRLDDYSLFDSIRTKFESKLDNDNRDLREEIDQLRNLLNPGLNNYYKVLINQLILLAEGIVAAYKDKQYQKSYNKLEDALKQSTPEFNLSSFHSFPYSAIELRVLMNLAFVLNKLGNHATYFEIMEFCIGSPCCSSEMYHKLCHNLAGAYRRKGEYTKALEITRQGINYCEQNNITNGLQVLYYGKGLAEYNLNDIEYIPSINKAIFLCDILNKDDFKNFILKSSIVLNSEYDFAAKSNL